MLTTFKRLLYSTPEAVEAVPSLSQDLAEMGVAIKDKNTVVLPPPGHDLTVDDIGMLAAVGVRVVKGEGALVVRALVGTDDPFGDYIVRIVKHRSSRGCWRT